MKGIVILLWSFLCFSGSYAQQLVPLDTKEIDQLVERVRDTFNVPGIAVAVVKDGKVMHSKGYGYTNIKTKQRVTENTLFAIASNSKAFTTTALGILVDQGKLKWTDRVVDYIPEFKLYDPYVTNDFRIVDLLVHRSGLGLGAGDLMFWPYNDNFHTEDIIKNLRYLKQVSPFRTQWDYDNLLYMVAGEVIRRVSGQSWDDFVAQHIFLPLNMKNTVASRDLIHDNPDVAFPHVPVNGQLEIVGSEHNHAMNAAGGINSSVADLSKWVIMHLNNGQYGQGQQLVRYHTHKYLWQPQTLMSVDTIVPPYNTHFAAYALGFNVKDVNGYEEVMHTGGLAGFVSQITMYPELKLGIIVLTNQQSGAAFRAISNTIKDRYIGVRSADYVAKYRASERRAEQQADAITAKVWHTIEKAQVSTVKKDVTAFLGTYHDVWFGDVKIFRDKEKVRFQAVKSPQLIGTVSYYKDNIFIVKWDDRSFDADVFLNFQLDENNQPYLLKMEAISPLTDFSFDFQDLELYRK